MTTAARDRDNPSRRGPLGSVATVGAGIAVFRLLPSIWAACTDTEWDANRAWGIAGYAPLTALTVLVFCWAAYAVLATRSSVWVVAFAPVAATAVALLVVWAVVAWQHDAAGVMQDRCPRGTPPWWLSLIPL